MKLTQWELEKLLEALDALIEERKQEGQGTKNFERLYSKVSRYGEMTGKIRG